MAKVRKVKQLEVKTKNRVGMLAEVSGIITDAGVNIKTICASGHGDEAIFWIIAQEHNKAKAALQAKGFDVVDKEPVVIELEDKVGSLSEVAKKLKAANINLDYIYGTTCDCGCECACSLVFSSDNNDKAIEVLTM